MASSIKKNILEFIRSRETEQLDFLTALCDVNSYTFNKSGADSVSALVFEKLKSIFPSHRVIKNSLTGDHHILKTHSRGKSIYLLGHTDTVFPPDFPFHKCKAAGGWLTGPGTADMKGGLAVFVYALLALQQTGGLGNLSLTLILGADEENGSAGSRAVYELERKNASLCLVAECAGQKGEIVVSRHGKAGGRLVCTGTDRHVGSAAEEKASAVLELAHKVIAFESLNGFRTGVRVNVGRVEGGLGPGTIPGSASFLFDIRWQDEQHFAPLFERLEAVAAKSENAQCPCRMELLNRRPAMPLTAETERLILILDKTAKELGQDVGREHRKGTSDANFFGAYGVPTLDGFGPIGVDDHTAGEKIFIPSLAERTALLAFLLHNLKQDSS